MPFLFFPFGEPWSEFEAFLLAQSADDDEVTVKTWDQASDWDRELWARDFPYPTFTYQYTAGSKNGTFAKFAICPGECPRCGQAMVVGPSVTYTTYVYGMACQQRRKGYPQRCTECAQKDDRAASRRTSARYRERNPNVIEPRECASCGLIFTPKRSDARCCSGKCRAKLSREERKSRLGQP